MDIQTLRELQLKQFEILKVIKTICQENNIKFSLFAGTALGAVRHNGFIPWDDDLDIVMSRNDYIKFKQICLNSLKDNYFFQDYHTDKEFDQCFGKIRDSDTTYLESAKRDKNMNHGIFVDIFPFDVVPSKGLEQKKQYFYACLNMLLARGKSTRKEGLINYLVSKLVLICIPKRFRYSLKLYCETKITKHKNEQIGYLAELTSIFSLLNKMYPNDILDEVIWIDFEGEKMPIFKEYDKYLKIKFGNYMELPPIEERVCKHEPIKYSTKDSYRNFI